MLKNIVIRVINQLKNYEVFRNIFNNVHNNPDNEYSKKDRTYILNILKQISEEDYATAEVSLRSLSLAFSDLADELGYDDDTFIQYFSIDEKAMMNDLRIKTTDFASALSNEGEILINGEYIAVSEKLYLRIQELFPGIFR